MKGRNSKCRLQNKITKKMKFKKTICALAAVVGLGLCSENVYNKIQQENNDPNKKYLFEGTIDNEDICFYRTLPIYSSIKYTLIIGSEDGKTTTYKDEDGNLKIESFCVTDEFGYTGCYPKDGIGESSIEDAQKIFDDRLERIVDYKKRLAEQAQNKK
jgi:hypothetical protein